MDNSQQPGPSIEPSAPNFQAEFHKAQASGNYDFVLKTAKDSERMLREFRAAILAASFPGRESGPIAMGVNFLDKMLDQALGQVNALKRAEKESREALRGKKNGTPTDVIGPEEPETPAQAAEATGEQPSA